MRVILIGNRKLAKYVLQYLIGDDWNVVGVVAPIGQMATQQANFQSLDDIAQGEDIELIKTMDINKEETVSAIKALEPDLAICPGWSQIIEAEVLSLPTHGFTGFHSSKLPNGRGGAPVNWSMIHGEDEIYISYFFYTPEIDAGDIIKQKSVPFESRDDISTILEKLSTAARDILSELKNPLHNNFIEATPQTLESATYRPRRKPKDGIIDWTKNPLQQYNWIRAQTHPYPGAYTFFEENKITILESELLENTAPKVECGEVISISEQQGITVRSGEGTLRIIRVQVENEPIQWADEFAERYNINSGTVFGRHHAPDSWFYTGIRDTQDGTHYTTNLQVGEAGAIKCIMESPNQTRQIGLKATFEGVTILQNSVEVQGRVAEECEYSPDTKGTKTLKVEFTGEDDYQDIRYMKIFAH